MQSPLFLFGAVYFLLVSNFYYQSNGFVKFYNDRYCLWKVAPIVALALFSHFHGAGMSKRTKMLHTVGIILGGIGDVLIGSSNEGIVTGAIAFGIGHLFYMAIYAPGSFKIDLRLTGLVLVWGLITNQLCLVPLQKDHPVAVGIMMVYSIILTLGFLISFAQYMQGTATHPAGHEALWYRLIGYALFYFSDNILIFDHVGYPVPAAEVLILCSYYSAQFFIFQGLVLADATAKSVKSH